MAVLGKEFRALNIEEGTIVTFEDYSSTEDSWIGSWSDCNSFFASEYTRETIEYLLRTGYLQLI